MIERDHDWVFPRIVFCLNSLHSKKKLGGNMRSIYGHVKTSSVMKFIQGGAKLTVFPLYTLTEVNIKRLLYNSIVINSALVERIVTLSDKNELWDSILTNFEMTMKNEAIVQGTTLQAYRSVVKNYDFLKE